MRSILIISPDPDTLKTLTISFELKGYEISSAMEVKNAYADKADIVILDMIDSSNWKEVRSAARLAAESKSAHTALLLPRGFHGRLPSGIDEAFELIVEKPFELIKLIEKIHALK